MFVSKTLPVLFPSVFQPIRSLTPLKARRPFRGAGLRAARRPRGKVKVRPAVLAVTYRRPRRRLWSRACEKLSGWERFPVDFWIV